MKKYLYSIFLVTILFIFALPARADIVLIELDYSGTANATVTNINPTTGWLAPNPPFTVFNAAIVPFKSWVIGNATGSAPWTFDSTGTAVRNADLYTVSNYGGTSRLDLNPGVAATGQTYTIKSVQIDVKAAATAIRWQFAYQKADGVVNTLVGDVTIAAQTSSDPITTYTIDLSGEGLTATEEATTWTSSQGMRNLFYETTSGVNNDGFEVDVIRLTGTSGINTNELIGAPEQVDLSVCPPGVDQIDIYLLLGQSNMKGIGAVPPVQTDNPLIVNMNMADNLWYEARHPLHKAGVPDLIDGSDNAGVGPGLDFARGVLSQTNGVRIALVPCAVGGSWIDLWARGGSFYANTMYRAQKALADGPPGKTRIKGVLWLQGESDSTEQLYSVYEQKLLTLVDNIRTDLNDPELPFIVCTIGSFIDPHLKFTRTKEINEILLRLPDKRSLTACVDARDLTGHVGDKLHYNTASQVIIGGRYADVFQQVVSRAFAARFFQWAGEGVDMTPALLVQYAIGGADGPAGSNEQVTSRTTESALTLAAVVRTNDPQLSVVGQMTTHLTGFWEPLNHPYGIPSAIQTNVPPGCERRDYSIPIITDPVKFLRLQVVHAEP